MLNVIGMLLDIVDPDGKLLEVEVNGRGLNLSLQATMAEIEISCTLTELFWVSFGFSTAQWKRGPWEPRLLAIELRELSQG